VVPWIPPPFSPLGVLNTAEGGTLGLGAPDEIKVQGFVVVQSQPLLEGIRHLPQLHIVGIYLHRQGT